MKILSHPSSCIVSFHVLRLAASALALLLLAGFSLQANETVVVGPPHHTDQATIRALENESRGAVVARDFATLERLWSEHFVVNAPDNKIYASRAAVFDVFRRSTADLYSSYEKSIECIAFDGDLAIVMGVETVTPLGAAASKPAQRRYTNVWRIVNGTWRLIARQATMVASSESSRNPVR